MIRDTSITIEEAAQLVKCSYHAIHGAIRRGDLPAYKPGKIVLILESDLNEWFQSTRFRVVKVGRPRRCLQALAPEPKIRIHKTGLWSSHPDKVDDTRMVPNFCVRSALFGLIQRGQRKVVDKEPIATDHGLQIRHTGWQLDQADLDVFAHALSLASAQTAGELVRFAAKGFLTGIHRSYGKTNREWLKDSLRRLANSVVEIHLEAAGSARTQSLSYTGPLLDEFIHNQAEHSYFLKCHPEMARLVDAGWTQVPWQQHVQLKTDLAKWLHGFYASHRTPTPAKVDTLRHLCGSNCHRLSDYRGKLRIALEELVYGGFLRAWHIDGEDKVHVFRLPQSSRSVTQ